MLAGSWRVGSGRSLGRSARRWSSRRTERYLTRNGVVIRKFFLHVSRKEQKKQFLERLQDPEKNWKFSSNDIKEREFWDDYMEAYEDMIRGTATKHAPWYVVPADNKWFTRVVVAAAIVKTLGSLGLGARSGQARRSIRPPRRGTQSRRLRGVGARPPRARAQPHAPGRSRPLRRCAGLAIHRG